MKSYILWFLILWPVLFSAQTTYKSKVSITRIYEFVNLLDYNGDDPYNIGVLDSMIYAYSDAYLQSPEGPLVSKYRPKFEKNTPESLKLLKTAYQESLNFSLDQIDFKIRLIMKLKVLIDHRYHYFIKYETIEDGQSTTEVISVVTGDNGYVINNNESKESIMFKEIVTLGNIDFLYDMCVTDFESTNFPFLNEYMKEVKDESGITLIDKLLALMRKRPDLIERAKF